MKFSKDLVLVMNSIAVTTRGRWVKCKKVGGSESPSSSRVQTKKKKVSFPHARGHPTGTQTQSMFSYSTSQDSFKCVSTLQTAVVYFYTFLIKTLFPSIFFCFSILFGGMG
jgi:hypothetical protein